MVYAGFKHDHPQPVPLGRPALYVLATQVRLYDLRRARVLAHEPVPGGPLIVGALAPHPEARAAVLGAIEGGAVGLNEGVLLGDDLRLALDRVAFARAAGLEKPDPWQERLLRSDAVRVILNCSRQSGKSTV